MSRRNSKVGRPLKYVGQSANHIAHLAKEHGKKAAVEMLRAEGGEFANISYPTVHTVCKRYHMSFDMGRRAVAKAA